MSDDYEVGVGFDVSKSVLVLGGLLKRVSCSQDRQTWIGVDGNGAFYTANSKDPTGWRVMAKPDPLTLALNGQHEMLKMLLDLSETEARTGTEAQPSGPHAPLNTD